MASIERHKCKARNQNILMLELFHQLHQQCFSKLKVQIHIDNVQTYKAIPICNVQNIIFHPVNIYELVQLIGHTDTLGLHVNGDPVSYMP